MRCLLMMRCAHASCLQGFKLELLGDRKSVAVLSSYIRAADAVLPADVMKAFRIAHATSDELYRACVTAPVLRAEP